MRFREKLSRAMMGRYGNDQFNRFLLLITFVTLVVSRFSKIGILYSIALGFLIIIYWRMLSRNVSKRYQENQKYLEIRNRYTGWFFLRWKHLKERKYYKFFRCPTCGQKVRVPKGKGQIEITCPKCHARFTKRS